MSLNPETHVTRLPAFFHQESAPGILLLIAAVTALIFANSPASGFYLSALHFQVGAPVHFWINDGLMAIFFLMVGLEIKKELMVGEISSYKKAILPFIGAVGGMLAPALIYVLFNHSDPVSIRGWAIPAATDIAFAVAVLSLFGNRVAPALKIFLLALAVIDDMGAVIIIALFYTASINSEFLILTFIAAATLFLMAKIKVSHISLYLLAGAFLWVFVLKSGVHATIAGVTLGLLIPINIKNKRGHYINSSLEHDLKPWVNFLIMPIFAFANAGVDFSGLSLASLTNNVTLGIMLGLFLGKQFGIFSVVWLSIKAGIAEQPRGTTWPQIYAVCIIAGIGFTMSLFIGLLAFPDPAWQTDVKMGVLAGSFLSAVSGYVVLQIFSKPK